VSLRALVASIGGKDARAVELVGPDGAVQSIARAEWRDPSRTPIVRVNRRAMIKFQWIDQDGKPLDGGDVRDVRELHISTTP
jgi:hypothetical protein